MATTTRKLMRPEIIFDSNIDDNFEIFSRATNLSGGWCSGDGLDSSFENGLDLCFSCFVIFYVYLLHLLHSTSTIKTLLLMYIKVQPLHLITIVKLSY